MKFPNQNSKTIFSVIIPTYNRANFVGDAIESVIAQNLEHVEIIVIDDGSTDNTKEIIETFGTRIIYEYQPNQGISAARNKGVSLSSGKYISFLDSDDVFLPGKMKRELECFNKFPDADLIVSDAELFEEGRSIQDTYMKKRGFIFHKISPYFFDCNTTLWIKGSMFPMCSITLQRRVLNKIDTELFDTSFKISEDWDLEIRMIRHCKILVDPRVTCHVRRFTDEARIKRKLGLAHFHASVFGLILRKSILDKALLIDNWPHNITSLIKQSLDELHSTLLNNSAGKV